MASNDLRDVLNLPSDHSVGPRPSKKQKTSGPRPNLKGLAREVQNLGGDNPIAIVPPASLFKKRRLGSRKPAASWELAPFKNSARNDHGHLVLHHWRRKKEDGAAPLGEPDRPDGDAGAAAAVLETADTADTAAAEDAGATGMRAPPLADSTFAKYNVRVDVPEYTDEQYLKYLDKSELPNADWTKEETDYLMGLVRDFDLRWTLIWDRYDFTPKSVDGDGAGATAEGASLTAPPQALKPRSMEDLKARYYEVAAKMMAVQKSPQYMTAAEYELWQTMAAFNKDQERARKAFALATMSRSRDEAREEESLLIEIRRLLARTERFNEDLRELYNRLDYPASENDIGTFKTSAGLQSLLHTLMNLDKTRKRRSVMGAPGDGPSPGIAIPGSAATETGATPVTGGTRRESIAASSTAGGHNRRDSIAGTPATPAEPTPTSAVPSYKDKKKGSAPSAERRKLTEHEEAVYGVSHFDRLSSGPTFRYEKINKLFSHKSGQQQLRITNALAELDVPPRLSMPTAAVTAQFEVLWSSVTALVDLRKVNDKLDGEIKIEEAKKAERDKARPAAVGSSRADKGGGQDAKANKNADASAAASGTVEKKAAEKKAQPATAEQAKKAGQAKKEGDSSQRPQDPKSASGGRTQSTSDDASADDASADDAPAAPKSAEGGGDGDGSNEGKESSDQTHQGTAAAAATAVKASEKDTKEKSAPTPPAGAVAASADTTSGGEEKANGDEKTGEGAARPGSSGSQLKRSASVLSVTSNVSAKRPKK